MLESIDHTLSRKVSDIFDLYTQLHDIRISLFNPEGKLIYPDSVGRPNCRYCSLLRETLGLDSKCRDLDREMMQAALERRGMIVYTCHAGMREAATPVIVDNGLVGYVMLGQFRSEAAPEKSPCSRLWKKAQGGDELQAAYEQTTVFPEQKIARLLDMFRHLLELIIGGQLIHHKDYDLVGPVIERIRQYPEKELSLTAASRLVGCSSSTISRLFRKVTGSSFKQYQVCHRLELAASQFRSMPSRTVAEVAHAVGYDDPLYFSRAFRKHFGSSPTEYRRP